MPLFDQVNGQETTRRPQFFRDQFGRLYFSQVEIKTGDPCQMPTPHGWSAPAGPSDLAGFLNPPADPEIVVVIPARDRALKGYDLYIDHDRWLEKHADAQRRHMRRRVDVAKANDLDWRQEAKNEDRSDLDSVVGPPPFPPRIFILAARAGNPWAIGKTEEVPTKVEAHLPRLRELLEARGARHRRPEELADPFAEDRTPIRSAAPAAAQYADPFAAGATAEFEDLDLSLEQREAAEDAELAALETETQQQLAAEQAKQEAASALPTVGAGARRSGSKKQKPEPAVVGEV